jgi:hypothetical protein
MIAREATVDRETVGAADIFPSDAAEAAPLIGADKTARTETAGQPWRVLCVLSALMGFASISTDLYLPAMPAMGTALAADTGLIELTVSGFLIGFSLGQLLSLWAPPAGGDRPGALRDRLRWLRAGWQRRSDDRLAHRAGARRLRRRRAWPRHGPRPL